MPQKRGVECLSSGSDSGEEDRGSNFRDENERIPWQTEWGWIRQREGSRRVPRLSVWFSLMSFFKGMEQVCEGRYGFCCGHVGLGGLG